MRSINTFMIVVLIITAVLVAGHYATKYAWMKISERHRVPIIAPPVLCLPPPQKFPIYSDVWLRRARETAHALADQGNDVTVDMVWERCPPVPGMDRRIMSVVFDRKDWEVVGHTRSVRTDLNHGRSVAVWRRKGDV